ncbi:MAG TPA: S9 family peptidase [Candidatus Acidoferrales bacterium]
MRRVVIALLLVCLAAPIASSQVKRAITFEDLISFQRIADPQISPDGKSVAFTATWFDLEANQRHADIWLAPMESGQAGGEPRQLTRSGKRDERPRWSPDGKTIAFQSNRDGEWQIYLINVGGGEARKLTTISTGATDHVWSDNGRLLAFASDVYPDCADDACNKKRGEETEKSKVKAKIATRLLYRHWNAWKDGRRTHVFVVPAEGGTPKDLTPGDYDAPTFSLGGPTGYALSPDGKELAYVSNHDPVEATSTNSDIWIVPTTGGQARPGQSDAYPQKDFGGQARKISTSPGADDGPQYSPDGRYLAFRSQFQAGYESDRWRLLIYDRRSQTIANLTETFDRSVDSCAWSPDSKKLYLVAEDKGHSLIYSVSITGAESTPLVKEGFNGDLGVSSDGKTLVFTRSTLTMPAEIFRSHADGSGVTQLTDINREKLSPLAMNPVEHFWFDGALGDKVHGLLVRPPNFDPDKKYPLVYLVHGGPQSAWNDNWGYRWNAQMFASPGFVVAMVNFHGSTGFGQKFTDDINSQYGGFPFDDLMKGLDYILAKYPFVDKDRLGVAGASFGGYMVNWLIGHTDRFKCAVSHAGVFNIVSKYGSTEELWFPEWDLRGTPYDNRELYEKWNPFNSVNNFKTPTLVTHGELDYRVTVDQGLQLFTALQRKRVPSKLLYFPDEGHWILKPQNSRLWFKTVLDWLATYLK